MFEELSSMDKEIGKLKPGKKILRNDGKELDDDDDTDGTVAVEEDEADSIDADSDDVGMYNCVL